MHERIGGASEPEQECLECQPLAGEAVERRQAGDGHRADQKAEAGPRHASQQPAELFDLARPELDWVKLAAGMGVDAARVETLEGFADVFKSACGRRGPFLIEFRI